jgi:hypothetical protein
MTEQIWALIKDGVIDNVIVWDGQTQWTPPEGYTVVNITGINPSPSIGWAYADGQFIAPIESIETGVEAIQGGPTIVE